MTHSFTITSLLSWATMAIIATTLTGCAAGLDGDYACDKVGGINGCTDMMEVRNLANTGAFNPGQTASPAVLALSNTHQTQRGLSGGPMDFIPLPRRDRHGFPIRTSEFVQKITIFPFINKNGDYVDTTDVYIVLDKSRWTGRPAKLIRGD
ncbi:type IV conjugative transfer system lipoprotein TraV [Shewanella benthica]|nr:type IV conjugative transfer system lipoprotein TraV [Shewanella benthica]